MKKIIAFVMSLLAIMFLIGCNENYQIKTSHMSETLNQELEDYFKIDNESKDQEIKDLIYIDDLMNNYEYSNKYLISIDNEYESKYFCAYLDIKIKDILDSIGMKDIHKQLNLLDTF